MAALSKNKKPKKALWKRILKWSGITFLLLIVLLILAPFLFKPQIIDQIEKAANNNLNADVEIGDVELSIFSTFPKFTLTLIDVKVQGRDEFKEITLADLPELQAKLNFWSVVGGGKYEVEDVRLIDPKIHIKVLEDGKANYDIALPDSSKEEPGEEVPFELALKQYSIENGSFIYDDASVLTYFDLIGFNHSGALEINGDVYGLSTNTDAEAMSLVYDDVAYINKAATDMKADVVIDMTKDMIFEFKENVIQLNALKLHADGKFIMDDRGYKFDELSLDADQSSFHDFLSMIPAAYALDMGGIKTNGTMGFKGMVNGYYADDAMPAMKFDFKIADGMIQYPGMPSNINNLNIDAHINKADESVSFDGMVINLSRFDADFAGNTLRSKLIVKTPESDPNIEANLNSNIDLASLSQVIPDMEGLNGLIKSDVFLKGKMSSIDNEKYEEFDARGDLLLTQMVYPSADLPDELKIDSLKLEFSPQALKMKNFTAAIGKSNFKAQGEIYNYMGYYFRDELLKGEFDFSSNYLNADAFMTSEESAPSATSETSSEESSSAFNIPSNIDFKLHTSLDEVLYSGTTITQIKGDVHIKDAVADLQGLRLNAFGGTVELNGLYDTKNVEQPHMEMGYKLVNIDISQAVTTFANIEKLAPIAKYCQGSISSEFDFKGDLTANLDPIYSSLLGEGNLKSTKIDIKDFKPLSKMASALNQESMAVQTLKNVSMKFAFKDGKVNVTPFDVTLGGQSAKISGSTSFEQDLDYKIATKIPKSKIPASAIQAAEKAMGKLNNLGLDLGQLPNEIPVDVLMLGKIQDPKISTNLQEQLLSLTGNLTDKIKDQLMDKAKEIKDSLVNEVKDKVEDVKDDLKERRDKIMADAQVQADKVKSEAKIAADKIRSEADKAYEEGVKAAGNNPIKKKAAEVAGKKAKDNAYQKADKLESEANAKADKIMSEAQLKANKLE